jgi:hypothetical protein
MASGARSGRAKAITTSEARRSLPTLAKQAAKQTKPAASLVDNAVEIHPRGAERSAFLVPGVDVEQAQRQIEALEEELDDIALLRFLEDRIARSLGKTTTIEDFARELGHEDLLEDGRAA